MAEYINSEIENIEFEEIQHGETGQYVADLLLRNFEKIKSRMIYLENTIASLKANGFDGTTIVDNTSNNINVNFSPSIICAIKKPTSQVITVTVDVSYGDTTLKPGKDNSVDTYSYAFYNQVSYGSEIIANVSAVTTSGKLQFKLTIPENAVSDASFEFNITFKTKTSYYSIPIVIMSQDEALNGQGIYISTIFKKSETQPDTPTGGSYDTGLPSGSTNQGWSDGIPSSGTGYLWTSRRKFTSDGLYPQEDTWSTPFKAVDSTDIDVCFCYYDGSGVPSDPKEHGTQNDGLWHNDALDTDNWMAISIYSNGAWGDWNKFPIVGEKGDDGINGNYRNTIYKNSKSKSVEAPTLRDATKFVGVSDTEVKAYLKANYPSYTDSQIEANLGWQDGPTGNGTWWYSVATISGNDDLAIGTIEYDSNGNVTNITYWSKPIIVNAGESGQSVYVSSVFKRWDSTDKKPDTPTGGSFSNPVPDGWSDGIPAITDENATLIYESHRKFTSDGKAPQDSEWSEPALMADSANFDVCYTKYSEGVPGAPTYHGTQVEQNEKYGWHEQGCTDDIWMATSYKSIYGSWSNWTITKILGESGKNGDYNNYCFKQFADDEEVESPTFETPNFVEMTDDEVSQLIEIEYPNVDKASDEFKELLRRNKGWHDGPESDGIWYMSTCVIDGGTGRASGNYTLDEHSHRIYWSDPIQITGQEGSYNQYQYLINKSETECSEEDDDWSDTVSGAKEKANLDITEILHALPTGYYMWMRQRRYDAETKTWGEWEYIRITGEKGDEGTSIQIKSSLNSLDELYALASFDNYITYYGDSKTQEDYDKVKPIDGDCYIVDGILYTWSQSADEMTCDGASITFPNGHHFVNCGQFKGDAGESVYMHIRYADILDKGTYPSTASNTPQDGTRYIGVLCDSHKENTDGTLDDVLSAYTWSRFVGNDGYGYEYIYRLKTNDTPYYVPTSGECIENGGKTFADDDYLPPTSAGTNKLNTEDYNSFDQETTWTDNPTGISDKYPYEFMCTRRKINGSWDAFVGKPSNTELCSLYNYKGKDGKYTQTQYRWLSSLMLTDNDITEQNKDNTNWYETAPNQTNNEAGYYLWKRVRDITPAASSTQEDEVGTWSYIRETGEKGNTGTGLTVKGTCNSYEELFAMSSLEEYNKYNNTDITEDYYNENIKPNDGDAWLINGELWVWQESSIDITEPNKEKYGTECPSHKWYNAGSVKGEDGESSYIHTKWANAAEISTNEFGETIYTVKQEDLTSYSTKNDGELPGKYIGICVDSNKTDPTGATSYMWSKYNGDDGVDYEIIYTLTETAEAPALPKVTDTMLSANTTDKSAKDGKSYQDNDYIPKSGATVNGTQITSLDWTDNPQTPTEKLPYQWGARRTKENGLWKAWTGGATDTATKAFFYNNYSKDGTSAIDVRTIPSNYVFHKDTTGNINPKSVDVKVSAIKNGEYLNITGIQNIKNVINATVKITSSLPSKECTINVIPSSSDSQEDFYFDVVTESDGTYQQGFSYTVTKDGDKGDPGDGSAVSYYFDKVIQITESIVKDDKGNATFDENGNVITTFSIEATGNYASYLKVFVGGNEVQEKITELTVDPDEEVYFVGSTKYTLSQLVKYTIYTGENACFYISALTDTSKNNSVTGGTVYVHFDYNDISYSCPVSWHVTYIKGLYETVEKNVRTTIITDVDSKISDVNDEIKTIENTYVKTETASGWSEDINSAIKTANSALTLSNETSNTVTGFTSRIESVEETTDSITTSVNELERTASGLTSTISNIGTLRNLLIDSKLTMKYENPTYIQSEGTYVTINESTSNAYMLRVKVTGTGSDASAQKHYGLMWGKNSNGGKRIKLKAETTYTLSFKALRPDGYYHDTYIVATLGKYSDDIVSKWSDHSYFYPLDGDSQTKSSKELETYSYTFTTDSDNLYYEIKIEYNSHMVASNETHIAYLCQPMLEESSKCNGWSESVDDNIIIKGNLLDSTKEFSVESNSNFYINGDGYELEKYSNDSYAFYGYGTDDTPSTFMKMMWSGLTLSSYSDYAISFMSKTNSSFDKDRDSCITFRITDGNGNNLTSIDIGESNQGAFYNGYYAFTDLNTEWKKYTLHLHTKLLSTITSTVSLEMYGYGSDSDNDDGGNEFWIAQPKMEIGVNSTDYISTAEDITNQSYYTESNISQTSSSITLAVKGLKDEYCDAGLEIKGGKVSISGDVVGNMNGTFQGTVSAKELAVVDNDGNAVIQFTQLTSSMKNDTTISSDDNFVTGMPVMIINYGGKRYITNLLELKKQDTTTTYKTNTDYNIEDSFVETTFYTNINTGATGTDYSTPVTYYKLSCSSSSSATTMPTYFTYKNGVKQSGSKLCKIYSGLSITNTWEEVNDLEELSDIYFKSTDALFEISTSTYEIPIFRVDMSKAINNTVYIKEKRNTAIAVDANFDNDYATVRALFRYKKCIIKNGNKSDKSVSLLIGKEFCVSRSSTNDGSLVESIYHINPLSVSSFYTISNTSRNINYINSSGSISVGNFQCYAIASNSMVEISDSFFTSNAKLLTFFNEQKVTTLNSPTL